MNCVLFNELSGEEIFFKHLSTDDVEQIHEFTSDKDVNRFIGWGLMNTIEQTYSHIESMIAREKEGTHLYASVVLKSENIVIGTVMLFNFDNTKSVAEIGFVFNKKYWGKGYGTKSVSLVSNFAFESLNLHTLKARVTDTNIGSIKILEKNGYQFMDRLINEELIDNKHFDLLLFDMTNPKY